MYLNIFKSKTELFHQLQGPLFKNSLYMILTSITSGGFGFIFWILAAKYYSSHDIGVTTTLISSMALIILISRFGLDYSMMRFIPVRDKNKVFNTSLYITTFFVFIFGIFYISGIDIYSRELDFLKLNQNAILFLIVLVANSIDSLTGLSFVASREAKFQFIQNIIACSRILFIIPFVTLGSMGLLSSYGISFILSSTFAIFIHIHLGIKPKNKIDLCFLKDSLHYSAGNYISSILISAPNSIIPIIVLNILGPVQAGYYYIVNSIFNLISVIPSAIGTSLFVEGNHGASLKKNAINSLLAIFITLIPVTIILFIKGDLLLKIIGDEYVAGWTLLRVLMLSSFFIGINNIYSSIKRTQKDVNSLILLNSLIFVLLIGLNYIFILKYGLIGSGYAYIISYGLSTTVIIIQMTYKK